MNLFSWFGGFSKKFQIVVVSIAIVVSPLGNAQPLPGYIQQSNSAAPPAPSLDGRDQVNSSGVLSQAQLGALVAPVALYPDSLLAQVLIASTYPLEVAEAESWLRNNSKMSHADREQAIKIQPWDNSVKSLIDFPNALDLMGKDLAWTQKLGDAYLAQPKELFQAVQSLRAKAQAANNLKSGPEQTVATQVQSGQQVIVIQPTNPQVVYVPTYNPYLVYGPWPYPGYYPPPFYPYTYAPGGLFFSFGVGLAVGAAFWAAPHWGTGSMVINNVTYNNFNRAYNTPSNMAPTHYGQNSDWKYEPAHRANVPYTNSTLGNRFGNTPAVQQSRIQEARQQSARSFWHQNASQQERQNVQQVHQNVQKVWNNTNAQQRQGQQNNNGNPPVMRQSRSRANNGSSGGEGFRGNEHMGGGELHGGGFRH